jgi:adenosylcobinamide kinase/adenosylcobinamide-phosphate guanylyltransferase
MTFHSTARRTLVFGGARSGKSGHAEKIALASGHKEVIYIATARPADSDGEMAARIDEHRRQRPSKWITVEEPLGLGEAIQEWCAPGRVVLVDCLTVWLSNIMFSSGADSTAYPDVGRIELPTLFHQLRRDFLRTVEHAAGDLVLVSNEVGMGIVPLGAVSRAFTDEAGRLNQDVAAVCDHVLFVAAGLPLTLKGHP